MISLTALSFTKQGNNSGLGFNVISIIFGFAGTVMIASILGSSKSFSWLEPKSVYVRQLVQQLMAE